MHMSGQGAPMRVQQALEALQDFASRRGHNLSGDGAAACVAVITDWYESVRAEDVVGLDEDGDMLLFQWGTYDWGEGPFFIYDLTRQLILEGSADDDASIWQLNCELRYSGGPDTEPLGEGGEWCSSPSELDDFRSMIASAAATAYAQTNDPISVELRLGPAG
jgi:hypothetical protein